GKQVHQIVLLGCDPESDGHVPLSSLVGAGHQKTSPFDTSSAFAISSCTLGKRCAYRNVMSVASWPNLSAIARAENPMSMSRLTWLCLKSWILIRFTPVWAHPRFISW